jgi:hypothetical protein
MLDVDSFQNILEIVRCCVKANRADLIEPALIDRQHVGDVRAKIATERTARPAAASRSLFGEPTPAQRDALTEAVRRRYAAMAGKPAGQ